MNHDVDIFYEVTLWPIQCLAILRVNCEVHKLYLQLFSSYRKTVKWFLET